MKEPNLKNSTECLQKFKSLIEEHECATKQLKEISCIDKPTLRDKTLEHALISHSKSLFEKIKKINDKIVEVAE